MFNTKTHLGAFLAMVAHFHLNGLVSYVETKVLKGFVDSSGKETNPNSKIITVNGCLSTPERWQQFDNDWQDYLKKEKFTPDEKYGYERFVFHAKDFHTNNCKWMPKNLTWHDRKRIYWELIKLIIRHTEYRFGFGIVLEDFRQLGRDFPGVREIFFGHPGAHASRRCFNANSDWALDKDFSPTIDYVLDQGDDFWGELSEGIRQDKVRMRNTPDIFFTVGDLTQSDKICSSPLQAADIIAWECKRYFSSLAPHHLSQETRQLSLTPSKELNKLLEDGKSLFMLCPYQELVLELRESLEEILQRNEMDSAKIGAKSANENLDDLAQLVLERKKSEVDTKKEELSHIWRKRGEQKGYETQKRDGKIQ